MLCYGHSLLFVIIYLVSLNCLLTSAQQHQQQQQGSLNGLVLSEEFQSAISKYPTLVSTFVIQKFPNGLVFESASDISGVSANVAKPYNLIYRNATNSKFTYKQLFLWNPGYNTISKIGDNGYLSNLCLIGQQASGTVRQLIALKDCSNANVIPGTSSPYHWKYNASTNQLIGQNNACLDDSGSQGQNLVLSMRTCDPRNSAQKFLLKILNLAGTPNTRIVLYGSTGSRFRIQHISKTDPVTGYNLCMTVHPYSYKPTAAAFAYLPCTPSSAGINPLQILQTSAYGQITTLSSVTARQQVCMDGSIDGLLGVNTCSVGSTLNQHFLYDTDSKQILLAHKTWLCLDDGGSFAGATYIHNLIFIFAPCNVTSINQKFTLL